MSTNKADPNIVAWASLGSIVLLFVIVGLYSFNKHGSTVTTNADRLLSFVALLVVISSYAVAIGIIEGVYINSDDPADISTGAKVAIGIMWPLVILALALMAAVIRNFYITRDSKLFFFASFFVLLFSVLMLEIIIINKQGEFDNAKAIDTTRTNTFLVSYGVIVVFLGIYSIL